MSAQNQTIVTLVGAGGTAPYSFTIVAGPNTTIPATLVGSQLTVDASSSPPGNYSVSLRVTDQAQHTFIKTVEVEVVDPSQFTVLTRDTSYQPSVLPLTTSVALQASGGTGTLIWTLIPSVTTLPGVSIAGSTLSFSLYSFGFWSVGVRATDLLGNTATRLLSFSIDQASVVSVVDGHVLIDLEASGDQVGSHTFTLSVADAASNLKKTSFQYVIKPTTSTVEVQETSVNHLWGAGDATEVVYPIQGDLSGFNLAAAAPIVAGNGLVATIDPTTDSVIVTGPPTSFGNSEIEVEIPVLQGTTQVATITREFSLVSHSGTASTGFGSMTCTTRPYLVGELVGLNPMRPYFNSPSIYKDPSLTTQIQVGGALPLGLSLDSVTGLIYGTVLAADVPQSILNYVDSTGAIQGTVTVKWDILPGQFQLSDNLPDGQLQANYAGSLSSSSSAPLSTASLHRGSLPTGLQLGVSSDGKSVQLVGNPTQAGFFDLWISATNSSGQVAFFYKRLAIDYATPLVIITSNLQQMQTNTPYTQTINAVGGVQPYLWSTLSGALPAGITFDANSGVLSGTTSASSYDTPITFEVTDARGVTATAALELTINDALTIATSVIPVISPGANYQYQLQAVGGTAPYAWSLGSGSAALPGGVILSSSGILTGATSLETYTAAVIFKVTDSANNVTTKTLAVTIGSSFNLIIDTEGIGPLVRGSSYQGRLRVLGNGVAAYFWTITSDTPNALPAGLTLQGDPGNQGITATLSGTTSAVLLNYSVKVQVVDSNGNSAVSFLLLNTYSGLTITTVSLPQAIVGVNYSTTLACSGVNPAFTWSLDPSSPALPSGLTLSSAGVISGTPTSAGGPPLVVRVTDSLGDYTSKVLPLTSIASTLAITTSSLPNVTAGVPYSIQLQAVNGSPAYTWSISPNSPVLLPSGLNLNSSTGVISGVTLGYNISQTIIFRVTDTLGVVREVSLPLTVVIGLLLFTGPDTIQNLTTGSLGIVADGDVSGVDSVNRSFLVVARNCVSTTPSGFSFGVLPGFNVNSS